MQENTLSRIVLQTLDIMNAQAVREFSLPPDTYIGGGACSRLGEALASRGISSVFIVIDDAVATLGLADSMFRSLEYSGIRHCLCRQPAGEPMSAPLEEEARRFLASGCVGMVAIGGGSALDAGKAIAILAANPGLTVRDLLAPSRAGNARAPFIAVPTTAGSGSEASSGTVITDSATRHKHVIAHPRCVPDLAIIDACLMLRLPPSVTAATGIDALTHAIEAYAAARATPLTRALAYQALRLIGEALPVVAGRGDNVAARESMALASYMAGVAFSNAGLGLAHAMAHQIGPLYAIPHGVANAVLLPSVMAFNELVCKKDYADIGLALTGEIMSSKEAIAFVRQLIIDVGLPASLAAAGGKPENFDELADAALKDYCLPTNPRAAFRNQIIAVYQHAQQR